MKRIATLLLATCTMAFGAIQAQTLDEVINNHITAQGGKDKLAALKSVKFTGSMSTQGMDIPMTIVRAHQMGMRMDMEIMGSSNYQLMNTTEGWSFMPVMGMTEPKKMEDEQFKGSLSQLDIQGALFNYQDKGHKVELIGKEKVDGAEAYKLKMVSKDGKESNYFIDAKTYHLIKTSSKANVQGQEMDVETSFADFKQNADGYWFPYTINTMQGAITFEKIETNVPVDEKQFKN